jgi:putative DNA primase/helicase
MSEKRKRATPDELAQMLALMRAIGATAPLSRLDGSAAGSEGSQAEGEDPKKVRLAVRPGREPHGHTVRLSDVASETLRWLWPGRIPAGKITVLDGDPGLGKSTLLCELAARISRGDPLPGADAAPAAPRGVLLFSAEDDLFDTIRPRIDAAGGDPKRIVSFVAVPNGTDTGRPFALPGDLPILEAVVQRLDVALVIIDPLVAFLRPATSDQQVRSALGALKGAAERSGAAIVVVRHLNKSSGANPLYRGAGSIGIIAAARAGLLLAADPDDPERRILALTKGNLARPAPALAFRLEDVPGATVTRVVWDGESPWTATALLHAQRDAADDGAARRSVIDEVRAWLREALAAGPRPASELREEATALGIGRSSLYAARNAEDITIAKERTAQGRWIWTLNGHNSEIEDVALPGSSDVQHL